MKLDVLFNSWTKSLFIFSGIVLSIAVNVVANEGVNPFDPIDSGGVVNLPSGHTEGKHPLQQYTVKNYILMGAISSDNGQIALVRAKNGAEYFVRINDLLGSSGGKISKIGANGIEVSEEDKIVSLLVRNRSANNEKTE